MLLVLSGLWQALPVRADPAQAPPLPAAAAPGEQRPPALPLFPERAPAGDRKGAHRSPKEPPTAMNMQSFSRLARGLMPAVVNVVVLHRATEEDNQLHRRTREQGTGFLVNPAGYILTNNHVVNNAEEIRIRLIDERELSGHLVGRDEHTDLALLKIDRGAEGDFTWAPLGDSDEVQIGEWVMAIGNPFGLDHTVTAGIVSAKGRRDVQPNGSSGFFDFIQTDASINPGNSGGPLINIKGEVIGINTAINVAGSGIGFAIPINIAKVIAGQLYQHGRAVRSWLGVYPQPVTESLRRAFGLPGRNGALVAEVVSGSPAAEAGVLVGDVIVEFDGKPVRRSDDLGWLVGTTRPRKVSLEVFREGKQQNLLAELQEQAAEEPRAPAQQQGERPSALGLTVAAMTPVLAQQLNYHEADGLVVMLVEAGSPAMEAGVERGDVVIGVNGKPVHNLAEYAQAMHDVPKGEIIRLLVRREDHKVFRNMWLAFVKR